MNASTKEKPGSAAQALPDDVTVLKDMVVDLNLTIERLKNELLLLRRWRFGKKSEKFDPSAQGSLFGSLEPIPTPLVEEAEPESKARRKGHGRRPIPADLPVVRVVLEPKPEDLVCQPCGSDKIQINEEIRRELDYTPGKVFVRETVRPIYACPNFCEGQVVVAENQNDSPIEKGLAGPGLLAYVAVNKYADHLPLNRQEAMLARHGVGIKRSTMCGWMAGGAHLLEAFHGMLRERVLSSLVIHTDDTPVKVQDDDGKLHEGHLWTYLGDRRNPYVFYAYSPSRERKWPAGVLENYKGFIQADAFSGYKALYAKDKMTEVACWAHARRKFVEADNSSSLEAQAALAQIRALYQVERDVKEECAKLGIRLNDPGPDGDQAVKLRQERREERSKPILAAFHEWLLQAESRALPKSPLGTALGYSRNQWPALCVYASNGELAIDNNAAERSLRPVTVGRKNYLFFGSDRGGHTGAVLYSAIGSAKLHQLDPWKYLRDLFTRLPVMNVSQLPELLPDRWRDSQAAAE